MNIYTDHFGLGDRPFSLCPDPDYLYWSPNHQRAFTMLEYGILTRAPITLLSGDVGAGKTTLVHQIMRTVGSDIQVGLVSNAMGERGDVLRWVLLSLGIAAKADESYVDLFARFRTHLFQEHAAGRRVIVIIDEAQNLTADTLEDLRMFTNLNAGKDEILQLILVGQPELRDVVRRPDLRHLAQRVSAAFHLHALDPLALRGYIAHRMKIAGAARDVFSATASDLIHQATGGVPRLANQLCELALVYAYTAESHGVTRATVQQVLDDGVFFAHQIVDHDVMFRAGQRHVRGM